MYTRGRFRNQNCLQPCRKKRSQVRVAIAKNVKNKNIIFFYLNALSLPVSRHATYRSKTKLQVLTVAFNETLKDFLSIFVSIDSKINTYRVTKPWLLFLLQVLYVAISIHNFYTAAPLRQTEAHVLSKTPRFSRICWQTFKRVFLCIEGLHKNGWPCGAFVIEITIKAL